MSGEHRIGMPRSEAATGVGRARLHQHRPSLWAARQVERPGHMVEIAAVIDRPNAVRALLDPVLGTVGRAACPHPHQDQGK